MRHRTLDLKALQSFAAVLSAGSFTAAAKQLDYSQSAVSMQIRRLEDELGMNLLKRNSQTPEPTWVGREVLGYAREMLRLDRELRERLADQEIAGTVRLGLPTDYAGYIAGTLSLFAERYPLVEMEVYSDLSANLVEMTRASDIDLAIVTRPAEAKGGTLLRREPLVWVASPGSTAPQQEPLPMAVTLDEACVFRNAATQCLDAVGRRWRTAYESQTFITQRIPVSLGLALTVAIPSLLGPDLESLDAPKANLPELPMMDIRLHRSPGRASRAAQGLAELLTERIRDHRAAEAHSRRYEK
jgi:DNA-binding transcriptional LysR family regulator